LFLLSISFSLFHFVLTCQAGFFIRVTAHSDAKTNPLIPPDKRKLVEDDEELLAFLRFILEQNPIYRYVALAL
jgi:hypothetical protein